MRAPVDEIGVAADDLEELLDRPAPSPAIADLVNEERLPTISPIVIRGLREGYGSWKTICISRRIVRSSLRGIAVSSSPSKRTEPEVGFRSSRTQ